MRRRSSQRGIALVAALFAIVLVMTLLAVMVDVGTIRLRQATEQLRAAQADAGADAGAAWVRSLLAKHAGSIGGMLGELSVTHSRFELTIDGQTSAAVSVSVQLPGKTKLTDHLDFNLQENPQIDETPLQIVSTAVVSVAGRAVATRTVTTLLRTFAQLAPYSEIVGNVDDAGPDSIESPGDPAGQLAGPATTELLISAFTQNGSNPPVRADKFENDSWYDGNSGSAGLLP